MAQVETIVVIGAGILGREIAHMAAMGGYRTILEDILPGSLRRAENEIRANLDKSMQLGNISSDEAAEIFSHLEYASSVEEAAREAHMVIEAVPDERESKLEIFTLLDKVCRPDTILVANTFSLSITELASVTYRAQQCLGMHFVSPIHAMKRLEIIRGKETDDATFSAGAEVGKRMGKEVVVMEDR